MMFNKNYRKWLKICVLLGFLLLPKIFAVEEQTFANIITIRNFYNGSDGYFNITTEQDVHTYNCLSNSTNNFNFNLKRNVSSAVEVKNLTGSIDSLTNTCNKITEQYGDVSKYFQLYTTCNSDFTLCDKEKKDKEIKIAELNPFKTNYEKCSSDLTSKQNEVNKFNIEIVPTLQGNITGCSQALETSDSKHWLYFFGGAGIVGLFFAWKHARLVPKTQREKISTGLSPKRY